MFFLFIYTHLAFKKTKYFEDRALTATNFPMMNYEPASLLYMESGESVKLP